MKWLKILIVSLSCAFAGIAAQAQNSPTVEAPNQLIERVSNDVLGLLKNDPAIRSGNIDHIVEVVNEKVLPYLDFRRMTAMAIGPKWREATNAQKDSIEHEFQMMLIRTYAGALDQVPQDVKITMLPYRAAPEDTDVTVKTEIHTGAPTPVELSYRLRLGDSGWRVYNVNVAGVWMVENYRSQFQPILNSQGLEGLIKALQERSFSGDGKSS